MLCYPPRTKRTISDFDLFCGEPTLQHVECRVLLITEVVLEGLKSFLITTPR